MKKILLLISLMAIFMTVGMGSAAAVSDDCSKCHGTVIGTFTVDPPVTSQTCLLSCHGVISSRHPSPTWRAVLVDGAGYFKSPESILTPAATIHRYHNGSNLPAGSNACKRCHSAVTCKACHKPVAHTEHGSTEYADYPSFTLATGLVWGSQTLSCSTSECHSFYVPGVTDIRKDGKQLCINCHSTDKSGHNEANLAGVHSSENAALRLGAADYIVSCEGCHAKTLTAEHKAAVQNDSLPEDTECGYCHGGSAAPQVNSVVYEIKEINSSVDDPGIQAESRNCSKCHFDEVVLPGRSLEHVTYHIASESDNIDISGAPHEDCNTCHANTDLMSTIYSMAKTPISDRDYSCFTCHNEQFDMEPVHLAGFDGDETEITEVHPGCGTCHTPGSEYSEKVGEILTGLSNGAGGYECMECHSGETLDEEHNGIIDANCTTTCHKSTLTLEHLDNPITQVSNEDNPLTCGTCHKNTNIEIKLAITTGNIDCTACHNQAHNFNMIQKVPVDIALYPGFQWSTPQSALIWADEAWMPSGYEGAKLIISNRMNVNRAEVWDYYREQMSSNGWAMPSVQLSTNSFTAEFVKDRRKVMVFFYGGENHAAEPILPGGYRLEILYK